MNGIDLDYAETTPELVVTVNRQRAAELGIPAADIAETLEIMLGGVAKPPTLIVARNMMFTFVVMKTALIALPILAKFICVQRRVS